VGVDRRSIRALQTGISQLDVGGEPLVRCGHQQQGTGAVERQLVLTEIAAVAIEQAKAGRRQGHATVLIRDQKQLRALEEEGMFDVD